MSEPNQPTTGPSTESRSRLESLVDAFESAWLRGEQPDLDQYLQSSALDRTAVLVELVHIDLERRLKGGEAARVEDYLERYPDLSSDEPILVGLVKAEYAQRRRREPNLALSEYACRFPALASELSSRQGTDPEEHSADVPTVSERPGDGTATPVVPGTAAVRYGLDSFHARGGMGEVWRGNDRELQREVALKVIQEKYRGNPELRRRFLLEAKVTAKLQHPGVVPIFGLVQDADGEPCYAMRFIEGDSLQEAIQRFHAADAEPRRDPGERSLA